jgi:hypothetical protein
VPTVFAGVTHCCLLPGTASVPPDLHPTGAHARVPDQPPLRKQAGGQGRCVRGHEPPRWIRALIKETGNPIGTFGPRPLRTLSSGERTRRRCSVAGFAEPAPSLSPLLVTRRHSSSRAGGRALTSFRDHTSGTSYKRVTSPPRPPPQAPPHGSSPSY